MLPRNGRRSGPGGALKPEGVVWAEGSVGECWENRPGGLHLETENAQTIWAEAYPLHYDAVSGSDPR